MNELVASFRAETALAPYPRDLAAHEIFEWYARRAPNAPAILFGDNVITYSQLDERTNQLARRLIDLGVRPGSVVGLLTYRSAETIMAWLATLKCGAAYLPIDPGTPPDAIDFIVEDCRPAVIISERILIGQCSGVRDVSVLLSEDLFEAAASEPTNGLSLRVSPTDPAYVMYTSGSTGKPKGVIVPHRGIVRLVRDQNYMTFASNEVFLLVSALAFDATTWEVWGALLNGARVGIVEGARVSIDQIASAIRHYGVTSIYLTAGLFHAIVDHDLMALASVRQLLVGGDVMSPEHAMKAMAAMPDCQLINGYGPTEATTFCVCYRLPREGWGGGSIPIGAPIAHTFAYILDEQIKPVANGEVGLLWTAGDGVSLGYLNRAELTAERFLKDPFRNDGSLMYLTGDLVRQRSDGAIEFIGRNDRQVKIDGKRVELDEIELNLRRDAQLADAIVVLKKTSEDAKKIVAFLKPRTPARAGLVDDVMKELRRILPPHMIPHEAALVDEFPLTKNGKVDRAKLLEMHEQSNKPASEQPPQAEGLESALIEIWSRNLDLPNIDRSRNFFDLGGTSLQMVRIHAEIRARLFPDIAITDLFSYPRIDDLARFLKGRQAGNSGVSAAVSRGAQQAAQLRRVQRSIRKPNR